VECVTEESARPLGTWLRQRREELGISLDQAEADTRIRARYLEALEGEDFEALPDPVVGRGFLRNYAAYLELDPQEAASRFSQFVPPPPTEPLPGEGSAAFGDEVFRPVPLHDMPGFGPTRTWIAGLAAVVLVVALALVAWWAYPWATGWLADMRDNGGSGPAPTQRPAMTSPPTATATPAEATIEPATATNTPTEAPPTLEPTLSPTMTPTWTPSPSPSPPVYTGIFLELVFTGTSWIQVTVDGVRQFQGELVAETYRSWYGEQRIELRVGNAGVVLVTLNGQALGTLGALGEVIDRIFEKVGEGVELITTTPEATSDGTPEPSETPSATPSPTPPATTETASPEPATPETATATASPEPATPETPTQTASPEAATPETATSETPAPDTTAEPTATP
jgi:cytoskeletal protein RodZ